MTDRGMTERGHGSRAPQRAGAWGEAKAILRSLSPRSVSSRHGFELAVYLTGLMLLAALFAGHRLAVFGLVALPLLGNRRTRGEAAPTRPLLRGRWRR